MKGLLTPYSGQYPSKFPKISLQSRGLDTSYDVVNKPPNLSFRSDGVRM